MGLKKKNYHEGYSHMLCRTSKYKGLQYLNVSLELL